MFEGVGQFGFEVCFRLDMFTHGSIAGHEGDVGGERIEIFEQSFPRIQRVAVGEEICC